MNRCASIPSNFAQRSGLLLAALLVLTLTACGRRESRVAEGNRTATLHVGIGGEPSGLDPHIINAPPDYRLIFAFFEGLTRNHPTTSLPIPGVAERWENSADGLTYTFHLRANARWTNGDSVTADDFVVSFRRALSPALGSQYTLLFNAVKGAEAYAAGKLTDFSQVGFRAPDARTLVVHLAQPTPHFLAIITGNPVWYPIHPATVQKHGPLDRRGTDWTRPEHFVGNGAFALKSWRQNQTIVAEKSPHYWDAANVRLKAIHFHAIDHGDTEERAFRAGQLHVTNFVPIARLAAYRAENLSLVENPVLTARFINVNTTRPVLRDPRVRRALSLALDRTRYTERVLARSESPAFNLVPVGMPGYTPTDRLTEDEVAARALLTEAGFPGGAGFPKLSLAREAGGTNGEVAQAIQETWRTKLGIEVAITESESRTHWSNLQVKEFDLSIAGWNADYPDASTFLDLFVSKGGWNFTGWADAEFDAAVAASSHELDPARRLAKLQQAEGRFLEAMPVIPLTFARRRVLVAPSVRDWAKNALDRPDYNVPWLASDAR